MASPSCHRMAWSRGEGMHPDRLLDREWLLTNGLGGYASGSVAGVCTRRYHGLLVAALPAPHGRVMMLNHLREEMRIPGGQHVAMGGDEREHGVLEHPGERVLAEFRLEMGLPVWRFEVGDIVLEKRIMMPRHQNTVVLRYRLLSGQGEVRLRLRPSLHFRPHGDRVDGAIAQPYPMRLEGDRLEVHGYDGYPLRMRVRGDASALVTDGGQTREVYYRVEAGRGYDARGQLWSPGYFRADLRAGEEVSLVASTENWETMTALSAVEAFDAEVRRRHRLIEQARPEARSGIAAELVLAADQFLILPMTRWADRARAHASGDEAATVIAGYPWFTDWGRDTMIAFEGLTLLTGRHEEAGRILRSFSKYIRDGLIPNRFQEGEEEGVYNTADASLWYFHAVDAYVEATGDRQTLKQLLDPLRQILEAHLRGTHFGIRVDPRDGLLTQGAEGFALTWMDAKMADWIVTPRRGKAVEINALWYNALRLMERWIREESGESDARPLQHQAEQVLDSFNRRFWNETTGLLYDIVDGPEGDDATFRPNQILSLSLSYPVLATRYWTRILDAVKDALATPVGLRTLAAGEPAYQSRYDGDLRSRDGAYHQGTVWPWLIGPFLDAWLRCRPKEAPEARRFLAGFGAHLGEACIGSVSEIFDADPPFTPRGCVAQAWSVAEVLRSFVKIASVEHALQAPAAELRRA